MILEFLLKNILLQYSITNMVTAAYVYTLGLLFMIKLTFAKISNWMLNMSENIIDQPIVQNTEV